MSEYSDKRPARRGFIFGAIIVGILAIIAAVLIVSSLVGGGDDLKRLPPPNLRLRRPPPSLRVTRACVALVRWRNRHPLDGTGR